MSNGELLGGLLSVFGGAGAGAAAGYNDALTQEEKDAMEQKKAKALADQQALMEKLRETNARAMQKDQNDFATQSNEDNASSGQYLDGKRLSNRELSMLSDEDRGKVISTNTYQDQQLAKTKPSGYYQNGVQMSQADSQGYTPEQKKQLGILNNDQYNKQQDKRKVDTAADLYNKTTGRKVKQSKYQKVTFDGYVWDVNVNNPADRVRLGKDTKTGTKSGDKKQKGDLLAIRKEAKKEVKDWQTASTKNLTPEQIENKERAITLAMKQFYPQYKSRTPNVPGIGKVYATIEGKVYNMDGKDVTTKATKVLQGIKDGKGKAGGGTGTGTGTGNQKDNPVSGQDINAQSPIEQLSVEQLQNLKTAKYPSAIPGSGGSYTDTNNPTIATWAESKLGKSQNLNSTSPLFGEDPVATALRVKGITKDKQTLKNMSEQLHEKYKNATDKQIIDMINAATNTPQATGLLQI